MGVTIYIVTLGDQISKFWQKMNPNIGIGKITSIWPPPRVRLYNVTTCYLAINFEEILSCFVLNVFLWLFCVIERSKLGIYLHNTDFWVIFGENLGIWPPGVTIYWVTPHCLDINFEEILSCFVLNVCLWLYCVMKMSKWGIYLHNTDF